MTDLYFVSSNHIKTVLKIYSTLKSIILVGHVTKYRTQKVNWVEEIVDTCRNLKEGYRKSDSCDLRESPRRFHAN